MELKSNQYFMSLPVYIQETIMQSGVEIHSEQELQQCAKNLMEEK